MMEDRRDYKVRRMFIYAGCPVDQRKNVGFLPAKMGDF